MVLGKLRGRGGILSRREQELRDREQELLERLDGALRPFEDAAGDDLRHLDRTRAQLDQLFLLVVAGEFNSGKSSFINALIGERVLPEGVTPTTDQITLLLWATEADEKAVEPFVVHRTHPAELLRELNVVDTPGTNAVIRRHEELTRDFVPRSDLVLFVTSADRPFTETERVFLEHIREWGKKVVVVINKIDILDTEPERTEVRDFVRRNVAELLGHEPEVFAVSARRALRALEEDDPALWAASGIDDIQSYLLETLDQEERVRLKLLNPLNVGLRLAGRYKGLAFDRLKTLAADIEAIADIDRQLVGYHQDMLGDLDGRLAKIDTLLLEMERRGAAFFEETVRIGRIKALLDSEALRRDFESRVIGDTPERVEEEATRVVDWMVERNVDVWREVERYIDRRQTAEGAGAGAPEGEPRRTGFQHSRQALLDSIGRVAGRVVGEYNREEEARKIANEVQGTFTATALTEVGAVGLGALVATLISGAAADVTGTILAVTLAVGGFYLIPRKRRQAKQRFSERIQALREQLAGALERQAHKEIARAAEKVEETMAPYRRFVESQRMSLEDARGELAAVESSLERLRSEIERA
ncbi:MAG: dynamin family protein [Gemmatimonadota bacterium]